jgi:rubredoxin
MTLISKGSTNTYVLRENPVKNDYKCPQCGKKKGFMDIFPNIFLTIDPPRKQVRCQLCGYEGYRKV